MTSKNENISDEELLNRYYQDNDNRWLGILLPRYSLLLFGVCMKYLKNEEDAKDCVQQVYLKVINDLHKFRVRNFKSWLYMVAKNESLMKLRGQKKETLELVEDRTGNQSEVRERELRMDKEERLDRLQKNLEKLKPEQQQCIRYFYMEKKSYAEIVVVTGYTLAQVKSYLQNGKRNLEIMMGANENET
ncbi:MAG: sigma-70 family RNA polymerase sigma factor [Chitinophagaceae bacterium]|nr:sigma-70 family RNA polymerase sigma factor [Chitinophagaceae bacterium]